MRIYSALLQGVNVGKYKRIAMADFRRIIADLGGSEIKTIANSGNAIFHYCGDLDTESLRTAIEQTVTDHIGIATPNILRSHEEIAAIIATNPYPDAVSDPKTLHVIFLKEEIPDVLVDIDFGEDHLTTVGRDIYLFAPHKLSGSTYDAKSLNKRLGTHATARNWNTVINLHDTGEIILRSTDN